MNLTFQKNFLIKFLLLAFIPTIGVATLRAGTLLNNLQAMVISIRGTGDLDAHFQLVSFSPDDAATMAQLLQAGILLRQFDARNADPYLATLLASVRVVPDGEGLEVSFAVTNNQLVSLIKRNTFSARR